jgi:hypothetical protein
MVSASSEWPKAIVLCQLFQSDTQDQLGAAAGPTPLTFDLLKAFQHSAHIDHYVGTVAWQQPMYRRDVAARIGGSVRDLGR